MHVLADSDLEKLLTALLDRAYGVALRMARSTEEAELLLGETVAEAVRRYPKDAPGPAFGLWFYRLLVEAFVKSRARRLRESKQPEAEEATELFLYHETQRLGLHSQSRDPAAVFLAKLRPEQIAAAVEALPDEYRVLCALFLYEDLRYVELAAILGVAPSVARSRLHRGRNMLQRTLWRVAIESGVIQEPATGNLA